MFGFLRNTRSQLKIEQDRHDKKKDKSSSKTWKLPKVLRLKSSKKKNVDIKKDKEENLCKYEGQRPITAQSQYQHEKKTLYKREGQRPITAKSQHKFGKNSLDLDHDVNSGKKSETTKSVSKSGKESYKNGLDRDVSSGKRSETSKTVSKSGKESYENYKREGQRPITAKSQSEKKSLDQDRDSCSGRRSKTNTSVSKYGKESHENHKREECIHVTAQSQYQFEKKSPHMHTSNASTITSISTSPNVSTIMGRHDVQSKHEHYNRQKVKTVDIRSRSLIPNGLPNLGNTCYFNATLQCLFWCKGFHALMNNKPMGTVSDRLMEVFGYLNGNVDHEISRPKSSIFCGTGNKANTAKGNLKQLLNELRRRNDQFIGYDQQDSFEMLNTILSSIQDEYKERNIRTSPVDNEFGGTFVTAYVHDQCKEVDLVFQNFTTISIPVMQTRTTFTHSFSNTEQRMNKGQTIIQVNDVKEAVHMDALCLSTSKSGHTGIIRGLREIAKVETMDAEILPCRKCYDISVGSILKKSAIIALPRILILHISRFSQSGRSLYKDQSKVSYPYILNISDVCSSAVEVFEIDSGSTQYELCGVVCHSGSMNSGHYIAYVNTSSYEEQPTAYYNPKDKSKIIEEHLSVKIRNQNTDVGYSYSTESNTDMNDTWYRISDSHVQISNPPLDLHDAYILFYRVHHQTSTKF